MGHLVRSAAIAGLYVAAGLVQAAAQTIPGSPPAASVSVKVGTVALRDLSFDAPGHGRWSIDRITFTGLVREGTRVRADRIRIDTAVVTLGSRTMQIPSIVIVGADLPAPLVPFLTGSGPAGDLAALLSSATIDRIAIEQVVQRDPSAQIEISYNNLVLRGLKDGHVASLRIGETIATMPSAPGMSDRVRLRMGEIRYQQFNMAEMARMITGTGSGDAKRILQRAVVDGIDITTDKGTARINRVLIADVDGRAPAQPLPADLNVQAAPGAALTAEQQKQAAAFAGEILRYARIGRYSIEGISVSAPGQGRFSLGAVTVAGLSGRGIERIEVRGFDFRMPGAAASFERFDLEGINYGALIDAALEAAGSGGKFDPSPVRIAQIMPRLSALRLSRLALDTPQGPVALGDLRFDLEELSEATNVSYAVRGLKIDLRRLTANDGRDKLIALGYGELVASMQARVSWQRKERALVVETVGLLLEQVARLDIAARLDNVDIDKALADPNAAQRVMGEALFGLIQIRLADLGLAERFYADAAKSAGVSPDTIRAGLAAEIRSQAIGNFGPLLAGRSADALAEFLRSPGMITARIAPAAGQPPLSVAEIQGRAPPELMQRLTITLEAGPK